MGRGRRLFQRLDDFIQSETKSSEVEELVKLEMQSYDVKVDLKSEIVKLISKIESGEPLIGNCDLCPDIQIAEFDRVLNRGDCARATQGI